MPSQARHRIFRRRIKGGNFPHLGGGVSRQEDHQQDRLAAKESPS